MAITSRFRHTLLLRRSVRSGTPGPRGHLAPATEEATIAGNLQERRARDTAGGDLHGLPVSDAIAFLPMAIPFEPDEIELDGIRYQVLGSARNAGGRGRHLELDLLRIRP